LLPNTDPYIAIVDTPKHKKALAATQQLVSETDIRVLVVPLVQLYKLSPICIVQHGEYRKHTDLDSGQIIQDLHYRRKIQEFARHKQIPLLIRERTLLRQWETNRWDYHRFTLDTPRRQGRNIIHQKDRYKELGLELAPENTEEGTLVLTQLAWDAALLDLKGTQEDVIHRLLPDLPKPVSLKCHPLDPHKERWQQFCENESIEYTTQDIKHNKKKWVYAHSSTAQIEAVIGGARPIFTQPDTWMQSRTEQELDIVANQHWHLKELPHLWRSIYETLT